MNPLRKERTPDFPVQTDRFGAWVANEPRALVRFETTAPGTAKTDTIVKPVIDTDQLTESAQNRIVAIQPAEFGQVANQVKAILGRQTSYKQGFDPEM